MWFLWVEEQFQPFLYVRGHVLEPRMVDPMLGSVFRQGGLLNFNAITVEVIL
jgi:hypothetical protein